MWDDLSSTDKSYGLESLNIFTDSFIHLILEGDQRLEQENVRDDFNSFVHHHTLIVDDELVFTGTNNWSQGGFYYNDESIIVTDVQNVVDAYIKQFDYFVDLLHGAVIDVSYENKNVLKLNVLPENSYKIIVYIEKSNPHWLGEVCFDFQYNKQQQSVKIPIECITETTRIFATDVQGKLLGSTYLVKEV